MAAHPLSQDKLDRVKQVVEDLLRAGFTPPEFPSRGSAAKTEAAKALSAEYGVPLNTARNWIAPANIDWTLYRPTRYQQPVPRHVVEPAPAPQAFIPDRPGVRVLAIGDLHNDPRHPHRLDVLKWVARYASEQRFDHIVQIGDWSTWDSCSFHEKNDTNKGKLKPSIRQDMDNLIASHQAFRAGMASDYKPRMTVVLGNHENRVERFENANPEAYGTFTRERDQIFTQFGWRVRPYGELFYIEGVGFTHHPVNGAGRAYGGKTGPQRAANDSTVPVVSGHTHRRQVHDSPKIGPNDAISMVEIGCGMLWGEVESYAAHSATGWWWGVVPLTCRQGAITDLGFVSMLTLQERFGRCAA